MVILTGDAWVDAGAAPVNVNPAYVDKTPRSPDIGMTPDARAGIFGCDPGQTEVAAWPLTGSCFSGRLR